MKRKLLMFCTGTLLLASCAPRYAPNASRPDSALSCSEVKYELRRAKEARAEAEANRGISAQNVAWFIVFWPGIVGNEYNNAEVMRKADQRIYELNGSFTAKRCR